MQNELKLLTETLWAKMQHLGRDRLGELITNPGLLHDAAKMGNLHLVTMILRGYPHLLFRVDADGHSLLHTVVTSRRENMLPLVERAGVGEVLDRDKNNLLHYAGMLVENDVDLRRAYNWFENVRMVVPPEYQEMKNRKGEVPVALFWKQHGQLLDKIEAYTKKRAESSIIIATVVSTLVFAAAFAPPGGYDQRSGALVLVHHTVFRFFMILELMALCGLWASILGLFYVLTSKQGEYNRAFLMPLYLKYSMITLLFTVFLAVYSFLVNFYLCMLKAKSSSITMAVFIPGQLFVGAGFVSWLYEQILETDTPWRGSRK